MEQGGSITVLSGVASSKCNESFDHDNNAEVYSYFESFADNGKTTKWVRGSNAGGGRFKGTIEFVESNQLSTPHIQIQSLDSVQETFEFWIVLPRCNY